MTDLKIRPATVDDADPLAGIFFSAFESIATRHDFPVEPGSPEFSHVQLTSIMGTEGIVGLVAERGGDIVGGGFQDERGVIVGIGPVFVDPTAMDAGVGRVLMEALLGRSAERGVAGVRLVQTAYHYRSLSLYAKLGFAIREPLSVFQGKPGGPHSLCHSVRVATSADLDACDGLCRRAHGHDRHGEVRDWIAVGSARVVEAGGRITGYGTGFGYGWHAIGTTDDDIIALLQSAEAFVGLGILVPSRNTTLMQWCLDSGLRLVQQSTLSRRQPTCRPSPSRR